MELCTKGHSEEFVAIKKLKEVETDGKEIEQEVSILDQFKCECIVHFHSVMFIPSKVCWSPNLISL